MLVHVSPQSADKAAKTNASRVDNPDHKPDDDEASEGARLRALVPENSNDPPVSLSLGGRPKGDRPVIKKSARAAAISQDGTTGAASDLAMAACLILVRSSLTVPSIARLIANASRLTKAMLLKNKVAPSGCVPSNIK